MPGLYERYQLQQVPTRFDDDRGRWWFQAHGITHDQLIIFLQEGIQARFPKSAPPDALPLLGEERGLGRYPAESDEAYRNRLVTAADFWRLAGTVPGLMLAMYQMGYQARVIEHGEDEPLAWSEFSVYLIPDRRNLNTGAWDDGRVWNDGFAWDADLTDEEKARIRGVIGDVKPAHTKLRDVFYLISGDIWDDGGPWDDGQPWNGTYVQF